MRQVNAVPPRQVVNSFYTASWEGVVGAPTYTASKHSVLGVMRSIHASCLLDGIRVGVIHPFFAG